MQLMVVFVWLHSAELGAIITTPVDPQERMALLWMSRCVVQVVHVCDEG